MSIGAISPVSLVGPVEGAMDGPLHLRDPVGDQTGQRGDPRHPHKDDPKRPPPRGEASKHDVDEVV